MATDPWDQFALAPAPPPPPASSPLRLVVPAQPDAPPAQTAEQIEGQSLTNEERRRNLATPKPVPGNPGYFFGPDGKPFKMDIPGADDPVKKAIGGLGLDELLFTVDRAKKTLGSGWWTTGVTGAVAEKIPGSDRNNLLAQLESLQGGAILEKLQALKEASATGASGMGPLSEREGARLAASIAALDKNMSDDELRLSLAVVDRHMRALKAIGEGKNPDDAEVQQQYGIVPLEKLSGPIDPEGTGDIGFESPAGDPRGNPLNQQQQVAYDAWLAANPNATPEQLRAFVVSIGAGDIQNAEAIIKDIQAGRGFVPGSGAVQPKPDISGVRGEGGIGEGVDAALRAGASILPGADKLAAIGDSVFKGGTYEENLARQTAITEYDWENHFLPSIAGTIGVGAMLPTKVAQVAKAAVTQAMRSGATRDAAVVAGRQAAAVQLGKEGGAYGAVHGGVNSQGDIPERALQAAGEGALGAVTGALLPFASAAGKASGSAVGRGPTLAEQVAFKAIKADGNTAGDLAAQANRADELGVPFMPADSGENARGLMSASARAPGPGRTRAIEALDVRQGELTDRVVSHIERDLGPVANPHRVTEALMTEAGTTATPLYQAAYARPGADTFGQKVAPLLQRPSMKRALANAHKIATEEGRDPTTLGFDFDEGGDVVLKNVPSWQTLDYVKRGMDDVVEAYRDPTSGRLNLNTEGRAVNNTLRSFIKAFDDANPDYAAARAAYAGPVKGVTALNLGRKALKMTADDLEERMRDMTPFERQMFAMGTRRAMAELVDSKGDTANVVHALVGTGKKRAMLARLFGNRREFQRFVDTLDIEQEAFETYKRARAGSPTAPNVADDSTLAVATGVGDLATSGVPIMSALRVVSRSRNKKLAERAQDMIAEMMGETDPERVRALIRRYKQSEARLRSSGPRLKPANRHIASTGYEIVPLSGAAAVPATVGAAPEVD